MVKYIITFSVLTAITASAFAQAGTESNTIETRINELEKQLKQLQDELAQQKQAAGSVPVPAAAPIDEQAIDAAVGKAFEKRQSELPKIPDWISRVNIYGDFRYRYQYDNPESKTDDRNQNLIQARLGFRGDVNDQFGYNFRIAGGNSQSPTSNNQTLGNSFDTKNLWLDLAYADYHPASIPGLNVLAGKILNPYYTVGNSDLLFDTDVTPEGIAGSYKKKLSDTVDVFGVAGGYSIKERDIEADSSLWGFQGGSTWKFGQENKSHLTGGAGYYDYGNVQGANDIKYYNSPAGNFFGNTATGTSLNSDFNLVQGFVEFGTPLAGLPFSVFGDVVNNTGADSGQDTGWLAGASLGKTTTPGTWAVAYNYRDVEADANLGVFADAAFAGGGTDVKGHKFTTYYQLAKNTAVGITYLNAERTRGGNTTDWDTFWFDFTLKF